MQANGKEPSKKELLREKNSQYCIRDTHGRTPVNISSKSKSCKKFNSYECKTAAVHCQEEPSCCISHQQEGNTTAQCLRTLHANLQARNSTSTNTMPTDLISRPYAYIAQSTSTSKNEAAYCQVGPASTTHNTTAQCTAIFKREKFNIHQKEDLTLPREKQPILPAYIPSTARTPVFSNKTMVRLFNNTDPQCLHRRPRTAL